MPIALPRIVSLGTSPGPMKHFQLKSAHLGNLKGQII